MQIVLRAIFFFILATAANAQEIKGPVAGAAKVKLGSDYDRIVFSEVFYGDVNSDGEDDALVRAFVNFEGGNSFYLRNLIFIKKDGKYIFVKESEEPLGQEASNVKFSNGIITLQTKVARPNDARCCPTGVKKWKISVPLGETQSGNSKKNTANFGTLAKRWCGSGTEAVQFSDGSLYINAYDSISQFSGVTFEGCTGMICTYAKKDTGYLWKTNRQLSQVTLMGPMYVGKNILIKRAVFGPCK